MFESVSMASAGNLGGTDDGRPAKTLSELEYVVVVDGGYRQAVDVVDIVLHNDDVDDWCGAECKNIDLGARRGSSV